MKTIVRIFLLLGVLVIGAHAAIARDFVVMTYNVHNGVGLDKKRDHQRIAQIIESQMPDFVAIQEVDSATNRSGQSFVLGEIGEGAGMHHVFAPAINFDGGLYGIGLLSRAAPDSIRRIPLPGREESRMLLLAHFKDCIIIDTHLSLTPEDALSSIQIIKNEISNAGGKPIILMGDLNSLPDSPVIKELQREFTIISPVHTPTFPANLPTEQIDYVMISKGSSFSVTRSEVLDEQMASDHRPIVVSLTISD